MEGKTQITLRMAKDCQGMTSEEARKVLKIQLQPCWAGAVARRHCLEYHGVCGISCVRQRDHWVGIGEKKCHERTPGESGNYSSKVY